MAASRAEQLICHRQQLAWLLYHPNEIERWEEETDETGYWLWWSGSLLSPPDIPPASPEPELPYVDLTNASDRSVSPLQQYADDPTSAPTPALYPPPQAVEEDYDADFPDEGDESGIFDNNADQTQPANNPITYPTPTISPPRPIIPPDILQFANVIHSIPKASNGLPSRNRLRHTPALAGEINKKTGILCIAKRGGRLRAFAYDDRLFDDELWTYLLGE